MTAETADNGHHGHKPFVDTVWMRLIALAIAIAGVLLFIATNMDFLERTLSGRVSGEPTPYQACLEERMDAVNALAREAGYTAKQKELAEIRAQEYCRNQTGT